MRLFHLGDRGEPVLDVQDRLVSLGYSIGTDSKSVFGGGTADAVAHFQDARGLPVDGIVGPETWRALVDAGYSLGDRMLYRRVPMMRGDDVTILQANLNSLGFDTGKVDGVFGPYTLAGLIDFQHNRGLAEDGIAGSLVASELRLIDLATHKHGREIVRERQWLTDLPSSIAGQQIYLDPECRNEAEAEATWPATSEAFSCVQLLGGLPIMSRSIDTFPAASLRAQHANRLNVDMVVSLAVPQDGDEGVFFFSSDYSRSEAGLAVAEVLSERLDIPIVGQTIPILKETRSPAVVVSLRSMTRRVGRVIANSIAVLYETPRDAQESGSNR